MRGMNRVFIVGRLGRDPEIRVGKGSGAPWATLSIATSRARKEGDGWVEETDWHMVKVFGAEVEKVERVGCKGAIVAVEGTLVYDTWVDDMGVKQRRAAITASRVQFVANFKRPGESEASQAELVEPTEPEPEPF